MTFWYPEEQASNAEFVGTGVQRLNNVEKDGTLKWLLPEKIATSTKAK